MKSIFVATVIASFLLVLLWGCKKNDNAASQTDLPFPENYMSKMGNLRYWHGTDTGELQHTAAPGAPFSYILFDTFSLVVNDSDLTVTAPYFGIEGAVGGAFLYNSGISDTVDIVKYLTFRSPDYSELLYYYLADSIVIIGGYGGIHGPEYVYLRTP